MLSNLFARCLCLIAILLYLYFAKNNNISLFYLIFDFEILSAKIVEDNITLF